MPSIPLALPGAREGGSSIERGPCKFEHQHNRSGFELPEMLLCELKKARLLCRFVDPRRMELGSRVNEVVPDAVHRENAFGIYGLNNLLGDDGLPTLPKSSAIYEKKNWMVADNRVAFLQHLVALSPRATGSSSFWRFVAANGELTPSSEIHTEINRKGYRI